jgi:hypothetical protein
MIALNPKNLLPSSAHLPLKGHRLSSRYQGHRRKSTLLILFPGWSMGFSRWSGLYPWFAGSSLFAGRFPQLFDFGLGSICPLFVCVSLNPKGIHTINFQKKLQTFLGGAAAISFADLPFPVPAFTHPDPGSHFHLGELQCGANLQRRVFTRNFCHAIYLGVRGGKNKRLTCPLGGFLPRFPPPFFISWLGSGVAPGGNGLGIIYDQVGQEQCCRRD